MDITGTLAKLLATENLTVQHSVGARTASFNVKDRLLTLPVLTGASQEVMTMLAAHEVGHALQTPTDWTDRVLDGTQRLFRAAAAADPAATRAHLSVCFVQ